MKLSADEFKVIVKYGKFRTKLWHIYINYIDPNNKLDIERKELMRSAFLSGCIFTMDSFYIGQEEDKK